MRTTARCIECGEWLEHSECPNCGLECEPDADTPYDDARDEGIK